MRFVKEDLKLKQNPKNKTRKQLTNVPDQVLQKACLVANRNFVSDRFV